MTPEQIQAYAGVGGGLLTAGVLWWEIHTRNRERRDAEAAQARTVVTEVRPGEYTTNADYDRTLREYLFSVTNHSSAPVLGVHLTAWVWGNDGMDEPAQGEHRAEEWTDVVPPGGTLSGAQYMLGRPWPHDEKAPLEQVAVEVIFTDAAGLMWTRRDNDGPRRFINPTIPTWRLRVRYRVQSWFNRLRGRE
ncbi:hypothetical protein ACWCO3_09150 [Micromonospora sp. NPDC002411]